MLKELEAIFNKQNKLDIQQYYEDGIFTDSKGNSFGTRVVIIIPKVYNYDLL